MCFLLCKNAVCSVERFGLSDIATLTKKAVFFANDQLGLLGK